MTPKQAQALYFLTAQPQWQAFNDYQHERIDELRTLLESCNERDLKLLQGNIEEARRNLQLRETAQAILEEERAKNA